MTEHTFMNPHDKEWGQIYTEEIINAHNYLYLGKNAQSTPTSQPALSGGARKVNPQSGTPTEDPICVLSLRAPLMPQLSATTNTTRDHWPFNCDWPPCYAGNTRTVASKNQSLINDNSSWWNHVHLCSSRAIGRQNQCTAREPCQQLDHIAAAQAYYSQSFHGHSLETSDLMWIKFTTSQGRHPLSVDVNPCDLRRGWGCT